MCAHQWMTLMGFCVEEKTVWTSDSRFREQRRRNSFSLLLLNERLVNERRMICSWWLPTRIHETHTHLMGLRGSGEVSVWGFIQVWGHIYLLKWAKSDNAYQSNNDIVSLCCYWYTCVVDIPNLIELEWLLRLYSYSYY